MRWVAEVWILNTELALPEALTKPERSTDTIGCVLSPAGAPRT